MTIRLSHFGCIKSAVLKGLRQMYIDGSCPSLGIGIKVSDVLVCPAVIDPNGGFCITRCTFLLTYHSRAGDKLKTEENVVVRFEGEKDQHAVYEITLCKHLDPDNELPIDPSIRLMCVAHPV